jgi:hypothetical protein
MTYFLPAAVKIKQKGTLESNAPHPVILWIKQVVYTCSRQAEAAPEQTQLASMLITLLNSKSNRRGLSRG